MIELREALIKIDHIASKGDVNIQPLLLPIRDVAHEALENDKQEPIGYFQADENGKIIWDEGCVCQDPVYPIEAGSTDISRPFFTYPPMRELSEDEIRDIHIQCSARLYDVEDAYHLDFAKEIMKKMKEK